MYSTKSLVDRQRRRSGDTFELHTGKEGTTEGSFLVSFCSAVDLIEEARWWRQGKGVFQEDNEARPVEQGSDSRDQLDDDRRSNSKEGPRPIQKHQGTSDEQTTVVCDFVRVRDNRRGSRGYGEDPLGN